MRSMLPDIRHAIRLYRQTPVSSLIAVVVLAVGLAFFTSFTSLYIHLVHEEPAGFENAGRIVTIGQRDSTGFRLLPLDLIDDMAEEISSLEAAAGFLSAFLSVGPDGQFLAAEQVTRGFDDMRPSIALGRGLLPLDHEPDAEPVIVISDDYWRFTLGSRPDVLGETIDIATARLPDGELEYTAFRIVGVKSAMMSGLSNRVDAPLWIPFESLAGNSGGPADYETIRSRTEFRTLGRLRPGASVRSLVNELSDRYSGAIGETWLRAGHQLSATRGIVNDMASHREAQRQIRLFLAGSVLLALVAAANVSLFLLARAPGRRRELGIRLAVGARMRRLAGQLATEAGLLVLVAGAFGTLTSVWLINYLRSLAFLRRVDLSAASVLDWRIVLIVSLSVVLLTTLVSVAPVLGLRRLGIGAASGQSRTRASFAQRIAANTQIAIAGPVAGAAIAFTWYLGSLLFGYPGYEIDDRYFVRLEGLPTSDAIANIEGMRETITSIPGVTAVSFTSLVPAEQPFMRTRRVQDPVDPNRTLEIGLAEVDSQFVDILGLKLLHGRIPTENDNDGALVNRTLAERFFGRSNVVGESIEISSGESSGTRIIGVLDDVSFQHPADDIEPILFEQGGLFASYSYASTIVASELPAGILTERLQELIDSGVLEFERVSATIPLANLRNNRIAPDRARGLLTIAVASLVILLTAFGFYGTQRYLVAAGRREYALRASLGAGPTALGRLVIRRGLSMSLPGLIVGALLAFTVVAWLRDGFLPRDVTPGIVTFSVAVALVSLLAGASFGPARQARRAHPATTLRED